MFRNRKQHIRKKIVIADDEEENLNISTEENLPITNVKSPISNNNSFENIEQNEDEEPSIVIKPRNQKTKKPKKSLISFDQDEEENDETPTFKLTKSKASKRLSKGKGFGLIDENALNFVNNSSLSTNNTNSRSYDIDELNKLKKLAANGSSNKDLNNVYEEDGEEFENLNNKDSKVYNQDFIDDEEDFKIDENPETPKLNSNDDTPSSEVSSEDEEVKRWELRQIQRANPQNKKVLDKLKTSIGPPKHPGSKVIPLPDFKTVKLNLQGVKDTSEVRLKLSRESKEEIERNLNSLINMKDGLHEKIKEIDTKLADLRI
ncbi:hypothetical protein CONCODRAFT_11978 [Conidiobolus coronatus NRRL 28638]|uniref:Uncharacterized protein n=1 Tax=Conidiobolus coronatus (strain ATCC 28846 / CBS 209.66 / NRRL 28638) TaxID=796925 RepID=A0A137NU49_CONC2|nr:hypothetical protein CONCODRAFT_11978 [Conidiobolus coronatus NRRL 28638]|eukprot:KXN66221.1 hypothetical protein CONCODRAFT_11978 [Conidiobolus coronatus NRRL 28638]